MLAGLTAGVNVYTITVTDTATVAQGVAIADATSGTVNFLSVTDTLINLSSDDGTNASRSAGLIKVLTKDGATDITVSGSLTTATAADVRQVNVIDAGTTGLVTATISGTAAVLAGLTAGVNVYTITVTDASASAANLNAIDAKTSVTVTATAVGTISGTAAAFTTLVAAEAANTIDLAAAFAATISDPATVSLVNSIDGINGNGEITATISNGTAAALTTLTGTHAYTITVTDTSAIAADLNTIDAATSVTVTATTVGTISGTAAAFTTLVAAEAANTIDLAAAFAATISDPATVSLVNSIDGINGNGEITATISNGTAAALTTLTGTHAYTITVTDTSATAADLNTIDAATSVTVTATAVGTITGTLTEALAATADQANLDTASNVAIVLASGTASLTDLLTLDLRTGGLINATAITGFTGTAAQFDTFLATVNAGQVSTATNYNATVTDGITAQLTAPSMAQLTAVDAANGIGSLTYTTVRDTTANLVSNAGGYITGSTAAIVTDTVSVAQMTTIDGYAASGSVSVANTGKISDTFTNLLNDRQLNGGAGQYVINGPLVEVSVSVSGVTAANANVLANVQTINMATGATLSISDSATNISLNQAAVNTAFDSDKVQFIVTSTVSSLELSDLASGFGNASNISMSLATLSENYSIADATWAAQHGFTSQMNVFTSADEGISADTLQSINVVSLNTVLAPTAGTYSYEGLLKSLLNSGSSAGWNNIQWLGSDANETLALTGYTNINRSLKLDGGGGIDTITGTTSADWILGGLGNDILAGGNGNDILEGGVGDDRLTGGTGQDTLTGDSGADTFVFAAGDSGTISGTVFDTITGYTVGAGGDRLDLHGTASKQTNASGIDVATASGNTGFAINASINDGIISVSGGDSARVDSLTEWIGVARAVVTTNGAAGAFRFGDTYIYQENTGGDLLIKLNGLSGITSLSTTGSSDGTIWIS